MKKKTIDDAKRLAKARNGKCLSTKYINNSSKLKWKCKRGHTWWANYNNISNNKWCPYCVNRVKLTIDDAKRLAKHNKGKCLSKVYLNNKSPLLFECSKGHRFKLPLDKLKNRGDWCKKCYHLSRKLSLNDAQKIAKSRGGRCLSKKYDRIDKKLFWECSEGHKWKSAFNTIKHRKSWCPECFRKSRMLSIDEAHNIAKDRGGKCLSDEYTETYKKLLWECNNGHQWEAVFSEVKKGRWCPLCKNKTQTMLLEILENLFGCKAENNFKGFDWLVNDKTGKKLEIDIYFDNIGFAAEYDGKQHFVPIRWSKNMTDVQAIGRLKDIKKLDRIKDYKISKSDEIKYFMRFSYLDNINIENVKLKIIRNFPELEELIK